MMPACWAGIIERFDELSAWIFCPTADPPQPFDELSVEDLCEVGREEPFDELAFLSDADPGTPAQSGKSENLVRTVHQPEGQHGVRTIQRLPAASHRIVCTSVRKRVKNDVNICATIRSETVYDVVGECGPRTRTEQRSTIFLEGPMLAGPSPRMSLSPNFTRMLKTWL